MNWNEETIWKAVGKFAISFVSGAIYLCGFMFVARHFGWINILVEIDVGMAFKLMLTYMGVCLVLGLVVIIALFILTIPFAIISALMDR